MVLVNAEAEGHDVSVWARLAPQRAPQTDVRQITTRGDGYRSVAAEAAVAKQATIGATTVHTVEMKVVTAAAAPAGDTLAETVNDAEDQYAPLRLTRIPLLVTRARRRWRASHPRQRDAAQ